MEAITASLAVFFFILLFTTSLQANAIQDSTIKDPYALLHIIPNSDGSVTRPKEYFPTVPPNTSSLSISKDAILNPTKNTWVRVYLPNGLDQSRPEKLPIIVFVHGGGFVILSAATPKFDTLCSKASNQLNALVVSVEYRLAPEHRLPDAYEDTLEALHWVKEGRDEWVTEYGDVSKCVLMGESAGGNIVYNLGLRISPFVNTFKPLVIKGLVLIQPYFGGVKRTGSELKFENAKVLPLVVNDLLWKLSLPIGANRNHPYSNPFIADGSPELMKDMKNLGWQIRMVGCDGDPLFDRQVKLVKLLEKRGVRVIANFSKGGAHGVFSDDPERVEEVFQVVKSLLTSCSVN